MIKHSYVCDGCADVSPHESALMPRDWEEIRLQRVKDGETLGTALLCSTCLLVVTRSRSRGPRWFKRLKKALGLTAAAILALQTQGCTVEPSKARSILEAEGCSEIALMGYSFFGCGKDDSMSMAFSCTRNNRHVEGVLCGGFIKGYTVRYTVRYE